MATLTAVVLAILVNIFGSDVAITQLSLVATIIVAVFLFAFATANIIISIPMQAAEAMTTPRVVQLFRRDPQVKIIHCYIVLWALLSITLGAISFVAAATLTPLFFSLWIVLTGLAIDLATQLYRRVLDYLNPYKYLTFIEETAAREIAANHDVELCEWLDAESEISLKALRKEGTSLVNASVDSIRNIVQSYVVANRRQLTASPADSEPHQRASYILHYAFDRLALVYDQSLALGLTPLCNNILATFAKIAITSADADLSLVTYPAHYIGSMGKRAVQDGIDAIGVKATLTLVQIAKLILTEHDVSKASLEKPFTTIIRHLEEISKESFRKNKEIPIDRLTAPFLDLKRVFVSDKLAAHPNTPVILSEIDRVLADFANLELIMRTLPPIPDAKDQLE